MFGRTVRNLVISGGAAGGLLWGARKLARRARRFSFEGKVALVVGGSRGLGLVLARQLVDCGCQVAICARTQADVDAAVDELRQRGGEVLGLKCDVRQRSEVDAMVEEVRRQLGEVELLFNVAGIIQVGPLESMTVEDFDDAMATHFWGPLYTSLAVLPSMRERKWGRIVNISSIGGKRAVPHLIPYAASKFALVGLSNGMRTELMKEGIYVTTACPSLMRTGSPRNAIFKGQHRQEYAWFTIGDSLPVVSMSAEQAAHQILKACQEGRGEVLVNNPANLAAHAQNLMPELTRDILALVNYVLPGMGGIGRRHARGYESESAWAPSWLTQLTEDAARRNNEMRPHPLNGTG